MKKIKMSPTGIYVIQGLFLKLLSQTFQLRDVVFHSLKDADPKRLVAVVRQHDFQYGETSVGYVWKFEPAEDGLIVGKIWLGMNDKGEGSYTLIETKDIIGWCYLDEPVNEK